MDAGHACTSPRGTHTFCMCMFGPAGGDSCQLTHGPFCPRTILHLTAPALASGFGREVVREGGRVLRHLLPAPNRLDQYPKCRPSL